MGASSSITKVKSLPHYPANFKNLEEYLKPIGLIDSDNKFIISKANQVTNECKDDKQKAIAIHDYIRDNIQFGFPSTFDNTKASDVLSLGYGFCNPQSTLYVAMLRAVGIPARQHFVSISTEILKGCVNPGTKYVDHTFTELYLNHKWIKCDSYIVDPKLRQNSLNFLRKNNLLIGYGIHINGSQEFDGENDSFSQFVDDGAYTNLTDRDYGYFDDCNDFYAKCDTYTTKGIIFNILIKILAYKANADIENIRNGTTKP